MRSLPLILFIGVLACSCRPKEDRTVTHFEGKPEVPASIKKEHEYLLLQIEDLAAFEDSTGKVASRLRDLMQHHFKEEEDYALPPLGYLPFLAEGKTPPQSEEVIGLTQKLQAQVTHINVEHQMIKAYLGELAQAAKRENHPEASILEKAISKHAATEEEILFPAAILVGEYLKLKKEKN